MCRLAVVHRFLAPAALALALAACGGGDGAGPAVTASTSTPDGAVMQAIQLLRRNDINGLVSASAPPARIEQAKARWMAEIKSNAIDDEERAEFAANMARLTAPDAEAQLMAEVRPQLEQFNGEMRAQLPALIGMGKGMAIAAINESQDIQAEMKPQVTSLVNAIGAWLETGEFASVERAERAIAAVTAAARRLPVRTLDEVQALDFDGFTNLASIGLGGAKDALRAYDIDLDQALDSARAETVSESGDQATVRVHIELFDTPLSFDTQMVRVDGNWYGKDSIEKLDEAQAGS